MKLHHNINNLFLTEQERQESPCQCKFSFSTSSLLLLVYCISLGIFFVSAINHIWVIYWGFAVCPAASRIHSVSAEGSGDPQQAESTLRQRDWARSGILRPSAQTAQRHTPWCGKDILHAQLVLRLMKELCCEVFKFLFPFPASWWWEPGKGGGACGTETRWPVNRLYMLLWHMCKKTNPYNNVCLSL